MHAGDQEKPGKWQDFYPMKEGAYMRKKNSDRFENIFEVTKLEGFNLKTLLVLVGIKMKIVLDLRNIKSLSAFEDEMRKSKSEIVKKLALKENRNVLILIRELVIGKGDLKGHFFLDDKLF